MKHLTRRDFLRLAATTLGGAVLAGCGGRQLARMTETPVPAAPARPTISGAPTPTPPSLTGAPDLLLVNGKVITVDAKNTIAQAVAIKNGLIQAVGTSDELRARAGATTQIIDLKGKAVTPGLIDPHLHFSRGRVEQCLLHAVLAARCEGCSLSPTCLGGCHQG
jgi:hypothetical protein